MSLVRNGGFELGNASFWEVDGVGTIEASNASPRHGVYNGVYTFPGGATPRVINSDYIRTKGNEYMNISMWAKSNVSNIVTPVLYLYDADYSFIGRVLGYGRTVEGVYLFINTQMYIPEGVSFVRGGFEPSGMVVDDVVYIDSFLPRLFPAEEIIHGLSNLTDFEYVTADGDTSLDKKDMQMCNTFIAYLNVTNIAGVTPLLDVLVYEMTEGGTAVLAGTFAQASGVTHERIDLVRCMGREMYVEYDLGAATSGAYFSVVVRGE